MQSVSVPRLYIVYVACALHLIWGVLLLVDERAAMCTPIHHGLLLFRRPWLLAASYLVASAAAVLPVFRPMPVLLVLTLVMPQQMLLTMTAVGEVLAICHSRFADGVPRPWAFIAADQCLGILVTLAHTWALLDVFAPGMWSLLSRRAGGRS